MESVSSWAILIAGILILMLSAEVWANKYRSKQQEEIQHLHEIGNKVRDEFKAQLKSSASHILERPTRMFITTEPMPNQKWFEHTRHRILLEIELSKIEDFPTVKSMAEQYANEYRANPANRRYKLRIFFPPVIAEPKRGI